MISITGWAKPSFAAVCLTGANINCLCHEFPWILVGFVFTISCHFRSGHSHMLGNLLISLTWFPPPISSPAAHLLISSFLYLPPTTCSLPDCLVCFCQDIPRLFCYYYLTPPVFWPFACTLNFVYPACPSSAGLTDLPVLTLPACPSDSAYSACSLSDCLYTWRISWFWPCFGTRSKITSATHCVCCRAF